LEDFLWSIKQSLSLLIFIMLLQRKHHLMEIFSVTRVSKFLTNSRYITSCKIFAWKFEIISKALSFKPKKILTYVSFNFKQSGKITIIQINNLLSNTWFNLIIFGNISFTINNLVNSTTCYKFFMDCVEVETQPIMKWNEWDIYRSKRFILHLFWW
jgi:hypothetical protein